MSHTHSSVHSHDVKHEAKAEVKPDASPGEKAKHEVREHETKPVPVTFLSLYDCATRDRPWPESVEEWGKKELHHDYALKTLRVMGTQLPVNGMIERFIDEVLKEVKGGK